MKKVSEDRSLYSRAGRALGWSFASTAFGRLSTLAINVALARILGPKEFGTFAIALVVLLAILSFNELGVSLAIVRWPGDAREIAPTVTLISVLSSVVIYVACFFGAPLFTQVMGDPHATPIVRLLSLSVLIDGLVATPVALLQRQFRQDRKMLADLATTWLNSLVAIGCAVAGMGAMSLAVGRLVGAAAGGALFVAFAPQGLRMGFNREKARALLRFGLPLAGSSIIVFAVANVDKVIVGAVFGPVPLGFYVLAVNLSNWPVGIFSQPVRSVAPAALARLHGDPPAMRTAFLSTAGLLAAVTLPACALLAATSTPLVHFMYGPAWAPAATMLPWLALLAALRILFELAYDYFVVLAISRVVLVVQAIWLAALVPSLYLAARAWGPAGAAAAQFAVGLLVVLPLYLYELRRTGIAPAALGSRVVLPLLGSAAVVVAALVVEEYITVDLVALLVAGVAGLAAMAVLVYRMRGALRALRSVQVTEPADAVA
jgi:PST family polysaccharide transporter